MSIGHLLVGVAKRKITPELGCELAGFDARKGVATSIHDDLYARAMVIGNHDKTVAFATLDLVGIQQDFTDAVRKSVCASTGIADRDVIISVTHTHCGPVTRKNFSGRQTPDPNYMARLKELTIEAIQEAFDKRGKAVIKTGLVPVDDVAKNRRTESGEPVDRYAGVILAEDLNGHAKGIVVDYSCHPTVLGPDTLAVTRDFPNYLVERLNEHFGEDVIPIYMNGAEGNLSMGHKSYLSAVGVIAPNRTFEKAKELGNRLAQCVIDSLDTLVAEAPELSSSHGIAPLPLKTYAPLKEMTRKKEAALAALNKIEGAAASGQAPQEEVIARRQDLLYSRLEESNASLYESSKPAGILPVEVSVVRIGNTAIVSLPGENFVEIGLAIREESPFPRTMIVGLANDYSGYVSTIEQAKLSGYEVIASRVKPEASLVLEKVAGELLETART